MMRIEVDQFFGVVSWNISILVGGTFVSIVTFVLDCGGICMGRYPDGSEGRVKVKN